MIIMNFKKLPYYLLLILLTLGASLIIGLLSFGGLYVLWPSLIFASFAFILSVAYEGEIYFQNIKGALDKLFKPNYLPLETARTFLKDYFPHHLSESQWPQFFKDYAATLKQLPCENQPLNKQKRAEKRKIEKKLRDMERLFARILGLPGKDVSRLSKDEQALREYLMHYKPLPGTQKATFESLPEKYQALIKKHQKLFSAAQIFSALTAIFMGFGTTYLLLETFAVIPFLAAIPLSIVPILIVPMAIISGVAYGLLTYNTITNIIKNDRIRARFNKLYHDYKTNGLTWRNALMMTATFVLGSLAIMLTLCTAGTWWTIVKQTPPLFKWMRKLPSFVMGIITPIVTSIAALAFNLENSCESLDMIDEATQERLDLKKKWAEFKHKLNLRRQQENIGQLLNPFRLIIVCTIFPLRLTLFLGHLISIGVTADRVPGLTKIFSACLGFVSEFFEDLHYFVKHKHKHSHDIRSLLNERLSDEHEHSHDNDLPTRILNFVALPLYALSSLWNYVSSQFNPKERRIEFASLFQKPVEPEVPIAIAIPAVKPPIAAINVKKATQSTSKIQQPTDILIPQSNVAQHISQILPPITKQKPLQKHEEKSPELTCECASCPPKPIIAPPTEYCAPTTFPPTRRRKPKSKPAVVDDSEIPTALGPTVSLS